MKKPKRFRPFPLSFLYPPLSQEIRPDGDPYLPIPRDFAPFVRKGTSFKNLVLFLKVRAGLAPRLFQAPSRAKPSRVRALGPGDGAGFGLGKILWRLAEEI
jgi:hypothetical protein